MEDMHEMKTNKRTETVGDNKRKKEDKKRQSRRRSYSDNVSDCDVPDCDVPDCDCLCQCCLRCIKIIGSILKNLDLDED